MINSANPRKNRCWARRLRWWWLLQAAIAAAVVTLLGAGTASATTAPNLETRVGASTPAAQTAAGPHESIAAGQRWGNAPPRAEVAVATGVAANGAGDALLSTASKGAGKALPMNMQTVCDVACKYNVDISDVTININKARAGYAGSTASDGTITLTRSAFSNEEQLARTLAHERFHVDQIRSGMGYPTNYDAGNAWEQAAQAFEDDWWAGH